MMTRASDPIRVLLFEFVCGGGCFEFPSFGVPTGSLQREGEAMLKSVADELSRIPNVQVICPIDVRVQPLFDEPIGKHIQVDDANELRLVLEEQKQECDFFVVIAPEIENTLQFFTDFFDDPDRLLTPGPNIIEIGSDKYLTYKFLEQHQIPTPATYRGDHKDSLLFPMICKPRLGAGSHAVLTVTNKETLREHASRFDLEPGDFIYQNLVPGISASIAVFRTPDEDIFMPAVEQVLDPATFAFQCCRDSLSTSLKDRARDLLVQVISNLPRFTGYLGIDIVLGEQATDDKVIEINPRFTTSFCLTRALDQKNCFEFLAKIHSVKRE